MMVKRIVTNIASTDVSKAKQFYVDILGLDIVMDQGWIATFASRAKMAPQISIATEGGSGTPVPDISVEVDDLEEAKRRVHVFMIAVVRASDICIGIVCAGIVLAGTDLGGALQLSVPKIRFWNNDDEVHRGPAPMRCGPTCWMARWIGASLPRDR